MSWQDILKNVEFDATESCCEIAKTELLKWLYEGTEKSIREGPAHKIINGIEQGTVSCDFLKMVLEENLIPMYEDKRNYDMAKEEGYLDKFNREKEDINRILDEWEDCEDGSKEKVKVPIQVKSK
jgi:hypothetical protein